MVNLLKATAIYFNLSFDIALRAYLIPAFCVKITHHDFKTFSLDWLLQRKCTACNNTFALLANYYAILYILTYKRVKQFKNA